MRLRPVALLGVALCTLLLQPSALAQRRSRGSGHIRIVSSTTGATVSIDGEEVGTIPLSAPIDVRPGEHALQVTKRGYTSYNEEIRIRAGQTRDVEVDLLPLAGFLRVRTSQTDVRVFVDGNFIGNAPVEFDLPPGRHSIKISKPGFRDMLRNVEAEAGSEIAIDAQLEELPPDENPYHRRPPRPARWYEKGWVWLTVGAVVVAATAVTVGVAVASGGESALSAYCKGPPPCITELNLR